MGGWLAMRHRSEGRGGEGLEIGRRKRHCTVWMLKVGERAAILGRMTQDGPDWEIFLHKKPYKLW